MSYCTLPPTPAPIRASIRHVTGIPNTVCGPVTASAHLVVPIHRYGNPIGEQEVADVCLHAIGSSILYEVYSSHSSRSSERNIDFRNTAGQIDLLVAPLPSRCSITSLAAGLACFNNEDCHHIIAAIGPFLLQVTFRLTKILREGDQSLMVNENLKFFTTGVQIISNLLSPSELGQISFCSMELQPPRICSITLPSGSAGTDIFLTTNAGKVYFVNFNEEDNGYVTRLIPFDCSPAELVGISFASTGIYPSDSIKCTVRAQPPLFFFGSYSGKVLVYSLTNGVEETISRTVSASPNDSHPCFLRYHSHIRAHAPGCAIFAIQALQCTNFVQNDCDVLLVATASDDRSVGIFYLNIGGAANTWTALWRCGGTNSESVSPGAFGARVWDVSLSLVSPAVTCAAGRIKVWIGAGAEDGSIRLDELTVTAKRDTLGISSHVLEASRCLLSIKELFATRGCHTVQVALMKSTKIPIVNFSAFSFDGSVASYKITLEGVQASPGAQNISDPLCTIQNISINDYHFVETNDDGLNSVNGVCAVKPKLRCVFSLPMTLEWCSLLDQQLPRVSWAAIAIDDQYCLYLWMGEAALNSDTYFNKIDNLLAYCDSTPHGSPSALSVRWSYDSTSFLEILVGTDDGAILKANVTPRILNSSLDLSFAGIVEHAPNDRRIAVYSVRPSVSISTGIEKKLGKIVALAPCLSTKTGNKCPYPGIAFLDGVKKRIGWLSPSRGKEYSLSWMTLNKSAEEEPSALYIKDYLSQTLRCFSFEYEGKGYIMIVSALRNGYVRVYLKPICEGEGETNIWVDVGITLTHRGQLELTDHLPSEVKGAFNVKNPHGSVSLLAEIGEIEEVTFFEHCASSTNSYVSFTTHLGKVFSVSIDFFMNVASKKRPSCQLDINKGILPVHRIDPYFQCSQVLCAICSTGNIYTGITRSNTTVSVVSTCPQNSPIREGGMFSNGSKVVKILDISHTMKAKRMFSASIGSSACLIHSPDGSRVTIHHVPLLSVKEENKETLLVTRTQTCSKEKDFHCSVAIPFSKKCSEIASQKGSAVLVAGCEDGTLVLSRLREDKTKDGYNHYIEIEQVLTGGHISNVLGVDFGASHDSDIIVSVGSLSSVCVWKWSNGFSGGRTFVVPMWASRHSTVYSEKITSGDDDDIKISAAVPRYLAVKCSKKQKKVQLFVTSSKGELIYYSQTISDKADESMLVSDSMLVWSAVSVPDVGKGSPIFALDMLEIDDQSTPVIIATGDKNGTIWITFQKSNMPTTFATRECFLQKSPVNCLALIQADPKEFSKNRIAIGYDTCEVLIVQFPFPEDISDFTVIRKIRIGYTALRRIIPRRTDRGSFLFVLEDTVIHRVSIIDSDVLTGSVIPVEVITTFPVQPRCSSDMALISGESLESPVAFVVGQGYEVKLLT